MRGGKRTGAGRPVSRARKQVQVRMSDEAYEIFKSAPSKAEAVEWLIFNYLKPELEKPESDRFQ